MSQIETKQRGRLQGKVAIVTGGTGGIGEACCVALAGEGAGVVVVDLHEKSIQQTVSQLNELSKKKEHFTEHMGLRLDVSSESDMAQMAQVTKERFRQIDILVTCAGILRAPETLPKPMVDYSLQEWESVIDSNLTGVFLSNRAVISTMTAQRGGDIVNLSSTSGRQGKAHDSAYCASKFGVIGMTESLAEEVRLQGIRVQMLLPDAVNTPIWEQNGPIRPEQALAPERVADLVVYLLTLPPDTILVAPAIASFRTRRRGGTGTPGRTRQVVTETTGKGA